MDELEKIPEVGDVFEDGRLRVEVLEMDGKRIENVRVTDLRESESDGDTDDGRKSEPVQTEMKF